MGFRISAYDKCVAVSKDGKIMLCFHVDDLLVSGKSQERVNQFIKDFEMHFKTTNKVGTSLDYLGIHIDRAHYGITLSQLSMVDKLIKGVKGTANSPGETIESLESLSSGEKDRRSQPMSAHNAEGFRSLTALALYLSKRTRPDILHAVNKLCRNA
jgi:hypothetical protein